MRAFAHETPPIVTALRVLSWNLMRRVGARAEDVAGLVRLHRPDLVLLQEATEDLAQLPSLVGGAFLPPWHGAAHLRPGRLEP